MHEIVLIKSNPMSNVVNWITEYIGRKARVNPLVVETCSLS